MEADFSIRKEIESVQPPHADSEGYYSDSSNEFLNDETIRRLSMPPPPGPERRSRRGYFRPKSDNKFWERQYFNIVEYQQKLLLRQQKFNHHLLHQLVEFRASKIWKMAFFAGLFAVIYYLLQNKRKLELTKNPPISEDEEEYVEKTEPERLDRYSRYVSELNNQD
jgi:hypothetical protein